MATSDQEGTVRKIGSAADEQRPRPLRAAELVSGERQQIDVQLGKVQRQPPDVLRRVSVDQGAGFVRGLGDGDQIGQDSGLVVCEHDRHQGDVPPLEGVVEWLQVEDTIAVHGEYDKIIGFPFSDRTSRFKHGRVFDRSGNQRTPAGQRGPQSEVVRLCCSRGEDDLSRGAAEQVGKLAARAIDPGGSVSAEVMHA